MCSKSDESGDEAGAAGWPRLTVLRGWAGADSLAPTRTRGGWAGGGWSPSALLSFDAPSLIAGPSRSWDSFETARAPVFTATAAAAAAAAATAPAACRTGPVPCLRGVCFWPTSLSLSEDVVDGVANCSSPDGVLVLLADLAPALAVLGTTALLDGSTGPAEFLDMLES